MPNRSSDSQHVMPCYAQVNKKRTIPYDPAGIVVVKALTSANVADSAYSEIKENESANKITETADALAIGIVPTKQSKIFTGADGTVYEQVSSNKSREHCNPVKSVLDRQSLYADVDHTLKPPTPPPRNYES